METLRIYLTFWPAPPLSFDLGRGEVPDEAPAEALVLAAIHGSVQSVGIEQRQFRDIFCIYDRTQRRYLEYDKSLAEQGVHSGDHIIVALEKTQSELDRRFAALKPSTFESTVEDILGGN
jgi:hypothetical protein